MFKLLIITRYWSSDGVAISSVVAEFGSAQLADIAFDKLEDVKDVKAVKLY